MRNKAEAKKLWLQYVHYAGKLSSFKICILFGCHKICQHVLYKVSKIHFRAFTNSEKLALKSVAHPAQEHIS